MISTLDRNLTNKDLIVPMNMATTKLAFGQLSTAIKWCNVHCTADYYFSSSGTLYTFYFNDPDDQLLFVLAWS